ncbi:MAG: hypothetical protein V8S95_06785 [Odoribacter sp.]
MSEANNEFFTPKVPLMRLSEMYLIAAEGWLGGRCGGCTIPGRKTERAALWEKAKNIN